MKNEPHTANDHHKEGIALVIVLGMLSVLLLFGVAFSISMRTERMAAGAFHDVVRARHLTQTALYRVLSEDITIQMTDEIYPPWEVYTRSAEDAEVALLGDGLVSSFSAISFVPMSLRAEVLPFGIKNQNLGIDGGVDWLELRDPLTGDFYGEYAFLVVNNSGLLDANVIGARETFSIPRLRGFSPGEIRFFGQIPGAAGQYILPEVETNSLHTYRSEFRRFESVPELYYLTSTPTFSAQLGGTNRPLGTLGAGPLTGSMADNLHVFSRYPRGMARDDLSASRFVAYIGGNPAAWDLEDIERALTENSPSMEDVIPDIDAFIYAMQDYADDSGNYILHPPGNEDAQLNRFSAMRVPMINEVIVSNRWELSGVAIDGQTLRHIFYLTVETWYPFPHAGPEEFEVRYGTTPGAVPDVQVDIPPFPELSAAYQPLPPGEPGYATPAPSSFSPTPNSYRLTTFTYYTDVPVNGIDGPLFPEGVNIPFRTSYRLNAPIVVQYAGAGEPIVDRVNPTWPTGSFDINATRQLISTDAGGEPITLGHAGASANDPRINWDPENQWAIGDTITPGAFNEFSVSGPHQDEMPNGGAAAFDGRIYSRRGPMFSVGELGYLLYSADRPWQTVRLLNPDPQNTSRIVDRFTVHTNQYRRGLLNINTRQTDALKAAFWTMPIDQYPTESISSTLVYNQTQALAEHIRSNMEGSGPIRNLSELKNRMDSGFIDGLLTSEFGPDENKFRRESFLRNSVGLLGTRNNLFTIFVAARVFSEDYDPDSIEDFQNREGFVLADQRAVAVVWRDPLRTFDGAGNETYQSWLQYFHWLTGALED